MTPRRIVITGATGGIGAALAREFAGPGVHLLLLGRNPDRLDAVCSDATNAGATATATSLDVRDVAAVAEAMMEFDDQGGVDLLLLAAGVKTGNFQGIEPGDQLDRVISVNLSASIHNVQALLPRMQRRRRGQIALFSSVAALAPQADLLSYSAAKAGIRAYGAALRRAMQGTGVSVHVITPGFVDSPMTDRHLGRTPMKVSAGYAARAIRLGLARGRLHIAFPLTLLILIRLQNLLPAPLVDWFDRRYRAQILPDSDEINAAASQAKSRSDET